MKYKLIAPINENYSPLEQILTNRGIEYNNIHHYINTSDDDINSPLLLNEDKLIKGMYELLKVIKNKLKAVIIVDCDVDGYTSAAILINFLYEVFPFWTENYLTWIHHSNKQHGLDDCIEEIIEKKYSLVICPDSGTNNIEEHKKINDYGGKVLILDHHLLEGEESRYAVIINNQIEKYPNKELSGCGITWQFCRYFNSKLSEELRIDVDRYLDLVALGLVGDMMSLKSIETKHLINKGFKPENINNPFIYGMWKKNEFKLGDHITGIGAAFYIVPFVNAITRSGTSEEKEVVFNSMLDMKAYQKINSSKRGEKDKKETIIEQAIRICSNVKRRQTKLQNEAMEYFEKLLEEKKDQESRDKVILVTLDKENVINKNIAGLIANKVMGNYKKPCCILTRHEEESNEKSNDKKIFYQGSARGCEKVGILNFKDICERTNVTEWTIGHQNAFGLKILKENLPIFIERTNEMLKDISDESIYYVDYIYINDDIKPNDILEIAKMEYYWGKDIEEPLIAIKSLNLSKEMITLMSPDKSPTLKFSLNNGINLIKFNSSEEEYEKLVRNNFISLDIIGKCNCNTWNGIDYPQILIDCYEIVNFKKVSDYF